MAQYDVAIVGGGLIGCAASFYLAQKGLSTVLIERGQINRQASGRNAGSLHFQLEHRLIRNGINIGIAPLLALSRTAIEDWRQLETILKTNLDVSMCGGLMLAEGDSDEHTLEEKQTLENDHGIATMLLSKPELAKRAPYIQNSAISAAAWLQNEGSANPRLVTPGYRHAAKRLGAKSIVEHELIAAEYSSNEWQLSLAARGSTIAALDPSKKLNIRANSLLIATGADIDRTMAVAGHKLPMNQLPLLMNISNRTGQIIPHFIQHASKNLSLKQVKIGNVLIGGGWPARFKMIDGQPDRDSTPEIILDNVRDNIKLAMSIVPSLSQTSLLRTWTGVAGTTPDELPYLGAACSSSRLYVAGGGSAFTLGPSIARLVSELIAGEQLSLDISPFDPQRFQNATAA